MDWSVEERSSSARRRRRRRRRNHHRHAPQPQRLAGVAQHRPDLVLAAGRDEVRLGEDAEGALALRVHAGGALEHVDGGDVDVARHHGQDARAGLGDVRFDKRVDALDDLGREERVS